MAKSTTRKGSEIFLICNNHSATLVMKFDVESYVKLMSLRCRRASLISSDLAALVKFFLFKNVAVVKDLNQLCCPSKSAQSLAVIFFLLHSLLSVKQLKVDTVFCFFLANYHTRFLQICLWSPEQLSEFLLGLKVFPYINCIDSAVWWVCFVR